MNFKEYIFNESEEVLKNKQIELAKKALKNNNAGVLGGATKEEAKQILKKFGFTDEQIKELEK